MSEINRILNDESNNDKELIRELSVYVKNHRDKGLPINRKFVKDVTDIVLRNSEINCENIIFSDVQSHIAAWWPDYNVADFNVTEILSWPKRIKKNLKSKTGDNKVFEYYEIIATIIHELTHARQHYISKFGNVVYNPFFELTEEMYETYSIYHDETLNERYANLREKVISYQVLSYIYPYKYIEALRYDLLYYLLYGYKIDNDGEIELAVKTKTIDDNSVMISAIENYNSILEACSIEGVNIKPTEDMTLYDRLYLGLPITTEEYRELAKLYNRLRTEDGDVKKLINKLQRN